jgi:pilus assembly protein Flp/PilA
MSQFFKTFVADDSGQDLIEYALIASLIGVALMSGMRVFSNMIGNSFNSIGNSLTNATA